MAPVMSSVTERLNREGFTVGDVAIAFGDALKFVHQSKNGGLVGVVDALGFVLQALRVHALLFHLLRALRLLGAKHPALSENSGEQRQAGYEQEDRRSALLRLGVGGRERHQHDCQDTQKSDEHQRTEPLLLLGQWSVADQRQAGDRGHCRIRRGLQPRFGEIGHPRGRGLADDGSLKVECTPAPGTFKHDSTFHVHVHLQRRPLLHCVMRIGRVR